MTILAPGVQASSHGCIDFFFNKILFSKFKLLQKCVWETPGSYSLSYKYEQRMNHFSNSANNV